MADGPYQVTDVSQTRMPVSEQGSETAGDKVRSREGNSPDPSAKALSVY